MPVLAKISRSEGSATSLVYWLCTTSRKLGTLLAALANPLRSPGTCKATMLTFEGSSEAGLIIAETFSLRY